nr:hypothetical protein [Sinorhizobium meliloti]
MVASMLEATPQAARRIVLELGLSDMTGGGGFGRGRYYRSDQQRWRAVI